MPDEPRTLQAWGMGSGIVIPDEVDPDHEHTRLTVEQMGVDMNTEEPWCYVSIVRERPGQRTADVLSVGITDPESMRMLRDVLNDIQIGGGDA